MTLRRKTPAQAIQLSLTVFFSDINESSFALNKNRPSKFIVETPPLGDKSQHANLNPNVMADVEQTMSPI